METRLKVLRTSRNFGTSGTCGCFNDSSKHALSMHLLLRENKRRANIMLCKMHKLEIYINISKTRSTEMFQNFCDVCERDSDKYEMVYTYMKHLLKSATILTKNVN